MIKEGIIKYRLNEDSKITLERNTLNNSFKFVYSNDVTLHEFVNENFKLMQELMSELVGDQTIFQESSVTTNIPAIPQEKSNIDNFLDSKFTELTTPITNPSVEMIQITTPNGVQVVPKSMLENQNKTDAKGIVPQLKVEQQVVVENGTQVVKPLVNANSLKSIANGVSFK